MSLYEYKATVIRVIDGDTADFSTDLGFDIFHSLRVRFSGINAPEKNTVPGMAAKKWLEDRLPVGTEVVLKTEKDRTEKFGRYLATVVLSDFTNVNEELIKTGNAVEYHGGKR